MNVKSICACMIMILGLASVMSPQLSSAEERATGNLELISATMDAKVFVDGEYVGDLPLDDVIVLPVGEHSIKIIKRGFTDFIEVITIEEGDNEPLFADLFPIAGILIIDTALEGAIVSVDGEVLGKTPFEGELEPGQRSIMVTRKEHKDYVQLMNIEVGQEYYLDVALERLDGEIIGPIGPVVKTPWYKTWWFWTATGVVLVGAATITAVALSGDDAGPTPDYTVYVDFP